MKFSTSARRRREEETCDRPLSKLHRTISDKRTGLSPTKIPQGRQAKTGCSLPSAGTTSALHFLPPWRCFNPPHLQKKGNGPAVRDDPAQYQKRKSRMIVIQAKTPQFGIRGVVPYHTMLPLEKTDWRESISGMRSGLGPGHFYSHNTNVEPTSLDTYLR